MKKKYLSCVSFILFAVFVANETVEAIKKDDHIKNQKITNVNDKKITDLAIKNKKTTVLLSSRNSTIKEVEVNSVNFIKLKDKANEIFIPDPTIIDVQLLSDNSLYLMGLTTGTTALVINDKDGNVMIDCKVRVTYPLKAIKEAITEMRPEVDVELVTVDKSVILKGRVPSPEIAGEVQDIVGKFIEEDKIINKLTIETSTQVMLKVKIAEVSRDLTKSLGISWRAVSTAKDVTGATYGFATGSTASFIEHVKDRNALSTVLLGKEEILGGDIKGGRWMVHCGSRNGLSGLIDALATESFASILAEPTIIALSGKKAVFKSGGEQGYIVSQPGDGGVATTEFKEWGTSIEFTPIVLSEDRINITVTPKISTLAFQAGNNQAPSLMTKEATTTVELGSGQSLAIAGLLQKSNDLNSSETPLLAELPLIGSLFRSSAVKTTEKEIVIIVTPYIVKPSSKQLKTPVEMIPKMYSPFESVLNRKFHRNAKRNVSAGFSIK